MGRYNDMKTNKRWDDHGFMNLGGLAYQGKDIVFRLFIYKVLV
jgi:hypothetical protein